jgi:(p)ppGpp synthase/HD superfamily hydrolase
MFRNMTFVPLSPRFEKALAYAAHAHRRQARKGSTVPYVSHLLSVAAIVLESSGTEDEAIAALLHDAPEDQGGRPRLDDVRAQFGDRVAEIVEACSDSLAEDPEQKDEWHGRKTAYQQHLSAAKDPSIYLVSAADKLHNARATLRDLRARGPAVWNLFEGKRDGTLWNYERLTRIYEAGPRDPRREPIVRELREVLRELQSL